MILTSCIIIARERNGEIETLLTRRATHARFLGGFYAFPGGRVEGDDHTLLATDHDDAALRGCAAREVFEELGIHLGHDAITLHAPESRRDRAVTAPGDVSGAHLRAFGRWQNDASDPVRFETEFYVLAPGSTLGADALDALPEHLDAPELDAAAWFTPDAALRAQRAGDLVLSAPTVGLLQHIATATSLDDLARLPRLNEEDVQDPWAHFHSTAGIMIVPMRSPTLPPATHTCCYLVGDERFVIIDPGSEEPEELARLTRAIDARAGEPLAVVLTHHHPDHIAGVQEIATRYGLPVWAHRRTAELLQGQLTIARHLEHYEDLALGTERLRCLHTPGHAPGHLCLEHHPSGHIFSGDMVAGVGTILVSPPNGHMGDYMQSLRALSARAPAGLLPAHGRPILNPQQKLAEYITHREEREEQVHLALVGRGDQWSTAMDLVPIVYAELAPSIWPLAAKSLLAHLIHLEERGRITRRGQRWRGAQT